MHRLSIGLLICLPLCLLMAPSQPEANRGIGALTLENVADDEAALPDDARMEQLAQSDPVAFLEATLRRYQRFYKGYSCTFQKQERIDGNLNKVETIEVFQREEPYSVYFRWIDGVGQAERTLYVEGENDGMLLARPAGRLARAVVGDVISRDPEGREARSGGRYSLKESSMRKGALRTLASWQAARDKNELHITYLGTRKVEEAGNRECYAFRRFPYAMPEEDGIVELTTFFDKETWLQVGSIVKGEGDKLIAAYYFRDIKLNPTFNPDQFRKAALSAGTK